MRFFLVLLAALFVTSPVLAGCLTPNDGCGGGDGSANTAVDTDGDGNSDYVRVRGDYNRDGLVDTDDIHDAVEDLTDTGPKLVEVDATVYGPPATLTYAGQIVLDSNTTLKCAVGATLQGYDASDLASKSSDSRIITTTATILQDSRSGSASGTCDASVCTGGINGGNACSDDTDCASSRNTDITIDGCTIEYPDLKSSYDSTAWTAKNIFGIYTGKTDGLRITNNSVDGTRHSCIYTRSSSDVLIQNNTTGSSCGGAQDTDTTSLQQGFYSFASGEGGDFADARYIGNTCEGAGQSCFHTRSQFACVGGTNDGTVCETDGAECTGGGTCTQAKIKNHTYTGNVARDATGSGFLLSSLENSTFTGNVIENVEYGFFMQNISDGQDMCDGANPSDDANCVVAISGNTIRETEDAVLAVGGGHMNIAFTGNTLENIGSGGANGKDAITVRIPFSNVVISGNSLTEMAGTTLKDFVGQSGTAVTSGDSDNGPLVIANNVLTEDDIHVGIFDLTFSAALSDLTIIGNTIISNSTTSAQSCIDLRDIKQTNMTVFGNNCPAESMIYPDFESTGDMDFFSRGSVAVVHEAPVGACESGAMVVAVDNSLDAITDHAYVCTGGTWAQMD